MHQILAPFPGIVPSVVPGELSEAIKLVVLEIAFVKSLTFNLEIACKRLERIESDCDSSLIDCVSEYVAAEFLVKKRK